MSAISLEILEDLVRQDFIKSLCPAEEPNFFDVGGLGHLENPVSDLMALFMGGEHAVVPWLAKALVACLNDKAVDMEWAEIDLGQVGKGEIKVFRESHEFDPETGRSGRLDIVVSSETFVIGIENKVFANTDNPFDLYRRHLDMLAGLDREARYVILHPTGMGKSTEFKGWPVLSYGELVNSADRRWGEDVGVGATGKWPVLYREFLDHLKGLSMARSNTMMREGELEFVEKHYAVLENVSTLLANFDSDLRTRAAEAIAIRLFGKREKDDVRLGEANWEVGRALRFIPKDWKGYSQVVLIYSSAGQSKGGPVFRLRGYVDFGKQIDRFQQTLEVVQKKTLPVGLAWSNENPQWGESKHRYLVMNVVLKTNTRQKALEAIADWAEWVSQFASE